MRSRLLQSAALILLLGLGGCASLPPGPERLEDYGTVEVSDVPFYPQQRFQCGPASLGMILNWGGLSVDPDTLTNSLFIPNRKGSLQPELQAQARRHGRLVYEIPATADALLTELEAGNPVLVLQNLALHWSPVWHYAVAIGYDAQAQEIILRSGTTARQTTPLNTFLRTWARGKNWGLLALPPGRLPATAEPDRYLAAAFELERGGQVDAARAAYRAGTARWPGQAGTRLALANLEYGQGDLIAAATVLQKALEAGAPDGPVQNNLALVLAELGRWDDAEAAAHAAVASGGTHAAEFRDTLSRIQCRSISGCPR